jgi:hypothetical protein
MNGEIGMRPEFLFWDYINGIFVAVYPPLLIENYMDHVSSGMFPKPRKRIRDHTWRKFLTKLKIMYKEIGLALYRDLYQ